MAYVAALLMAVAGFGQVEPLEELAPLEGQEPTQVEVLEPIELQELAPLEEPVPIETIEEAQVWLKYPAGTVLYVQASSLGLRTGPKRDAILVHYMPKDSRVVALEDVLDSTADKISSREGHWVYVKHGQHSGYTFDAYLAAAPPSVQEAMDWICEPGKRVGPINSKMTLEDLQAIFGEMNVREAVIPVADGKTERGTVIFPDDDERRLFVQWKYRNVSAKAVIIEGSRWRTTKGIGIGSRLSEILRANAAPISFAGFGWDYAGYVMSWRGGTLEADHVLRDDISLFLTPQQPYLPSDFEALQGDREFSSDLAEATKLNLHVSAMTILLHD